MAGPWEAFQAEQTAPPVSSAPPAGAAAPAGPWAAYAQEAPAQATEPKKFGLGDTWPAQVAKAVYGAVTLPGDVVQGKVDPGSQEAIRRSFDLAGVASPASIASRSIPPSAAAAIVAPAEGRQVAMAAERLGVDLPRAVTSDKTAVQQLGKVATNIPIGGTPLRNASREAIEQLGDAATKVERGYGSGDIAGAGEVAREGLERYIGKETADRANALYQKVDDIIDPTITRPLVFTQKAASTIEGRRALAAMGDSPALANVAEALGRPEGLTYEGVKQLRTSIGEILQKPNALPANISQSELKQIYGGLTKDLEGTVLQAGGPRAASMFQRANKYYGAVSDRRENLSRILKATNDEGVFDRIASAAGSTSRADVNLLSQARKALQPDEWNEVASGVISRIGRDAEGNFSPDRFVTGWGKLSDQGKAQLFGSQPQLRNALNDIAKVSSRFKSLNQFANPSGTGQTVAGVAGLGGLWTDPITLAGSVMSARVLSGILAKPATAQSLARWSKAYEAAITRPAAATKGFLKAETQKFSASIANALGAPRLANDLSRSLQGAINAGATPEQPEPERRGDDQPN